MTSRDPKRAFATLPSDPDTWVRTPEPATSQNGAKADLFTARMTIDVTPELRGRIKFGGIPTRDHRRRDAGDLLSREFPDDAGGTA
jgi:hypothetical protein